MIRSFSVLGGKLGNDSAVDCVVSGSDVEDTAMLFGERNF